MHLLIGMMLAWEVYGTPDMDGLATWYGIDDGSGVVFRSGEPFRLDAPYCAVDASMWEEYEGARLLVLSDTGMLVCTVADSGWLYDAGEFRHNGYRWASPVDFASWDAWVAAGDGQGMVVDIPHDTFVRGFGTDDTQRVQVWRVQ